MGYIEGAAVFHRQLSALRHHREDGGRAWTRKDVDEDNEAARRNTAREVRWRNYVSFQPTMKLFFVLTCTTSIILRHGARIDNGKH